MEGCLILRAPVRSWEKRSACIDKVTLQKGKGIEEGKGGGSFIPSWARRTDCRDPFKSNLICVESL